VLRHENNNERLLLFETQNTGNVVYLGEVGCVDGREKLAQNLKGKATLFIKAGNA